MLIFQRYKNAAGFTLVEVLVALFILSVGILGVSNMFIIAIKANALGRNLTVANRLAQNLMEQVKTQTFGEVLNDLCSNTGISNCSVSGTAATATFKEAEATGGLNALTYTVTLTQVVNSPITGLNTVTVTVAWRDAYGNHTTKVITYMEKVG